MNKVTALEVADYIIHSPYMLYEDGYYYAHWNPKERLNYKGNSDPDNITVCVPCAYADEVSDRDEFNAKESVDDEEFMRVCDALADKLNKEINIKTISNGMVFF